MHVLRKYAIGTHITLCIKGKGGGGVGEDYNEFAQINQEPVHNRHQFLQLLVGTFIDLRRVGGEGGGGGSRGSNEPPLKINNGGRKTFKLSSCGRNTSTKEK